MQKQCNLYNLEPEFKEYLEKNNFSRSSINNYLTDLRNFLSWLVGKLKSQRLDFDIRLLNGETINLYKEHLLSKNVPVKSINRHISTLRTFTRFCIQQNWLTDNLSNSLNNIKLPFYASFAYRLRGYRKNIVVFSIGFISVLLIFVIPGIFFLKSSIFGKQNSLMLTKNLPGLATNSSNRVSSTSANLLTIPIIDQRGNLNLSAPYPNIIGQIGTLTMRAPQIAIESIDKGNISLNSKNGSIQFLFEAETPPLPYESAFYFASKELEQGTLIHGQTVNAGSAINLLELSSGLPTEAKFTVDADGNVHVRGNIILDGNLIVNPNSSIFGNLSNETATSSFSPAP